MQNYCDKYVVCPFYSQESMLKLHCEGFSVGNRIHICFDCKERMKNHKQMFCYDIYNYENCPLFAVIAKQYEEKKQ